MIDAFSRRIIGWRAARSMTTLLVLDALEHAIFTRQQEGITDLTGLVSHSDAGSVYTSIAFTSRLIEAGVDPRSDQSATPTTVSLFLPVRCLFRKFMTDPHGVLALICRPSDWACSKRCRRTGVT